jgi:hypothetical protein
MGGMNSIMNRKRYREAINGLYKVALWLHMGIFILILIALCVGIVGFVIKWFAIFNYPPVVINKFHSLAEDIFSLILVYEIMELLRQRNPMWLTDIFLTVLARKMLLSPEDSSLILIHSISFSLVLVCRVLLNRFAKNILLK